MFSQSKFNVVTHSSDFKHCPLRCDPNRGQRRQHGAAVSPRCDPMRGQRGKPSCALKVTRHSPVVSGAGTSLSSLPSTSLYGAGGPVIGSSSLAVESASWKSCGPASSSSFPGKSSSGAGCPVSGPFSFLQGTSWKARGSASSSSLPRKSSSGAGCPVLGHGRCSTSSAASGGVSLGGDRGVNREVRMASCSKDSSSVVVMHGHHMRNDFDLDSVFVPHSRLFSLCSSVVSKVSSSSSINSCGEHGGASGHKNSCLVHAAEVRRGTKAPSTSTRLGVRCPAVEELASPQQAPGSLHEEVWTSILCNQGPKISRQFEIIPGCMVSVACPACPDYSPEPPGPGRIIRNMIGWSLLEKNEVRSGVWLFRGALQGKNLFSSLDDVGDWERKGTYQTAWALPLDSSCACPYSYGQGPAIRPHTGRRCWPLLEGVWRAIAPLMKPWCAEGEVPTAANLNLYRGGNSCVGWHRDDELLFGEFGEAKLIVSVSLGGSAVFRWKRRSCPDDEGTLVLSRPW